MELQLTEVSSSSGRMLGAWTARSEAGGSLLWRCVSAHSPMVLMVWSVQASFRVLMGKEGMVTIVTGLSTV